MLNLTRYNETLMITPRWCGWSLGGWLGILAVGVFCVVIISVVALTLWWNFPTGGRVGGRGPRSVTGPLYIVLRTLGNVSRESRTNDPMGPCWGTGCRYRTRVSSALRSDFFIRRICWNCQRRREAWHFPPWIGTKVPRSITCRVSMCRLTWNELTWKWTSRYSVSPGCCWYEVAGTYQ